jgi:hypothetical protein
MEIWDENTKVECKLDILGGIPSGELQINDSGPLIIQCPIEPRLTISERLQNRLVNSGCAFIDDFAWGIHSFANVRDQRHRTAGATDAGEERA